MTCHNRRETTLRCLETVENQTGISDIKLSIFLVDDGSTDGTAEAVYKQYPQVKVLEGNGKLYWGGGMRKAMNAARQNECDFYLWLNDDVELYNHAIKALIETYYNLEAEGYTSPIVGGSFLDPVSKETTYGGNVCISSWHPLRNKRIDPGKLPLECDMLNGNLVLLSSRAVERVGSLDPKFQHAKADFEYSLRAAKKGITSWITPSYLGECSRNMLKGTWKDPSLPLWLRYKKLLGKKGEPVYPRFVYISTYGGLFWPFIYLNVYIQPLIELFKKKYLRIVNN